MTGRVIPLLMRKVLLILLIFSAAACGGKEVIEDAGKEQQDPIGPHALDLTRWSGAGEGRRSDEPRGMRDVR